MASVHEVIQAFSDSRSTVEAGSKFEKLMVEYFRLDPLLAQRYDEVWLWQDWPGRNGKHDTGIDLVAREKTTGNLTAVQCKLYAPTTTLQKPDIDSFLSASGKQGFTNRIIISTTDKWGGNAEDAIRDQQIPVERIGLGEISAAPVDWDVAWPADTLQVTLTPAKRYAPRPHQQTAIDKVTAGFTAHDRGQLIMACGTGKTFTALKLTETIAASLGGSARVLFLVPSISLLSQTLREWTAQCGLDMRSYAVCSDNKVSRAAEDITTVDIPIPVTTSPATLITDMAYAKRAAGLTVVFSTYQSLPTIAQAQAQGLEPFDLVICDEAHRTTGVTVAGEGSSNFVKVHDADYIHATKRLYMTATPRLFDEKVKDKAEEHSAEIMSMDDEATFGPVFHRLSFGDAVEHGLLTDYKVLVLTVDEEVIAGPLQEQVAGIDAEIPLDDASKIVGCWNGLAKRAGADMDGNGFPVGELPMKRAVAFAQDIKHSKDFAAAFPDVVNAYATTLTDEDDDDILTCELRHVDGTMNALQRNGELTWLKAPIPDGECRILTNARCLSEGVDVPALDAVMFLNPRNSVVDVVQSVGRVMRRAPGKDYGYIILPVAVPSGIAPDKALADNKRFKVVWQVLNALRAHDDRFNAMVNSIDFNKGKTKPGTAGSSQIMGGHVGPTNETESIDNGTNTGSEDAAVAKRIIAQAPLFSLTDWRDAVLAKIVKNVGTRAYWEDWAHDVADIANAQQTRIRAILAGDNPAIRARFDQFVDGLRGNLNDSITQADAISMLSQHLITKPVFDALFADYSFADHNPVAIAMQTMVDTLQGQGLEAETNKLEGFYRSVRIRASEVSSAEGKQQVITELYERFFKLAFPAQADALGIVYTPVEIVDFILRSADDILTTEFGQSLSDEGVHILDPFTGTGTFIVRLLQQGLIRPGDLARKYASELHANEIMLLAYYIAAVNIEATYHAMAGGTYRPFDGIVLTDTFQSSENGDRADTSLLPANNDRIQAQLAHDITVIVGNPPYSVGQTSGNDNNANHSYPTLDARIADTYAKRSTATLKNSLYDSYIRAIRWASDRVGDRGIVAFVTNGGWIDANTSDGLRLSLVSEYTSLYVFNLRGNQRGAGEQSRREGGKVFGSGSRATIAIIFAVKNPAHQGTCELHYRDIGDYLTREQKLDIIDHATLATTDWQNITPNSHGDWTNQRNDTFTTWMPIGEKGHDTRASTVFTTYSAGLKTSRDAWCYNFSEREVRSNVTRMIDNYNAEAERYQAAPPQSRGEVEDFVDMDPTKFKWDRVNKRDVANGKTGSYSPQGLRVGTYRPFCKQHLYFDPTQQFNNCTYQLPQIYPTPETQNIGMYIVGAGSAVPFSAIMTDTLPNLHVTGAGSGGQYFPRWTYSTLTSADDLFGASDPDQTPDRQDNVSDAALETYRDVYGSTVTKDDIFYYVYGLLHAPDYRDTYAADLKKNLPRIPLVATTEDFRTFTAAGRRLSELHINYESTDPYPLHEETSPRFDVTRRDAWRVTKMKWRSRTDKSAIVYNSGLTLTGIPDQAHRYMLGARSALEWLIDRYQVKTDKASGIVNDPNDWCDEIGKPGYIVDLIKRITTVSVETMKIVDALPPLQVRP